MKCPDGGEKYRNSLELAGSCSELPLYDITEQQELVDIDALIDIKATGKGSIEGVAAGNDVKANVTRKKCAFTNGSIITTIQIGDKTYNRPMNDKSSTDDTRENNWGKCGDDNPFNLRYISIDCQQTTPKTEPVSNW